MSDRDSVQDHIYNLLATIVCPPISSNTRLSLAAQSNQTTLLLRCYSLAQMGGNRDAFVPTHRKSPWSLRELRMWTSWNWSPIIVSSAHKSTSCITPHQPMPTKTVSINTAICNFYVMRTATLANRNLLPSTSIVCI